MVLRNVDDGGKGLMVENSDLPRTLGISLEEKNSELNVYLDNGIN
jgi:hypothetical protein